VVNVHNQLTSTDYFNTTRVIPFTGGVRNYVDLGQVQKHSAGFIQGNGAAGELALEGGGKLSFSANSIMPPGMGMVLDAYINPMLARSSIRLPHHHTDAAGKRLYLKSYGSYYLFTPHPIAPSGNMVLTLPIPSALQSNAPDSVNAWLYSNNSWVNKGYAKKVGNTYTKQLDQSGIWNFAVPVKGVYAALKVHTDAGLPFVNTLLRIRGAAGAELGTARTDADGNAVCFLPAEETLTLDLLQRWSLVASPAHTQILSFGTNTEASITLTTNSAWVKSIKGTARICNTGPLSAGGVIIADTWTGNQHAFFVVKDGNYGGAVIDPDLQLHRFSILNPDGTRNGSDSVIYVPSAQLKIINVNTCLPSTFLFANYSIDATTTNFTGDASNPNSPALYAHTASNGTSTLIVCNNNTGKSFEFYTPATTVGVNNGGGVSNFNVQGSFYDYDMTRACTVTFTRYDPLPGGYIEGSVDLYYKDNANVLRHFVANFRVKRLL
jgi:hypothetical protein